jgi:hypothetical protein
MVGGNVRYYSNGSPVGDVEVHAQGLMPQVANTDPSGGFTFTGLSETTWIFDPQKHGDVGSAITTLDAVYVLQAVVGLRQLSAEQQLACDTSGDGALSVLDAVFILQYVAGLIPSLPVAQNCGSDWAFVPMPTPAANQRLTEPQVATGSCRHGAIALEPLVSDTGNQDFSAVLFGDCTGDWQPAASLAGAAF